MDAIQSLTGCTFGKGNLIHRDYGKNAYAFIRRADGKAIRITARRNAWPPDPPERQALFEKSRSGTASPEERRRLQQLQEERALAVMTLPEDQLFEVQEVHTEIPKRARVQNSIVCDECGEPTMATRIRVVDGRNLCVACSEKVGA